MREIYSFQKWDKRKTGYFADNLSTVVFLLAAAKKADNQAAELSNILHPKEKDNDLSPRKHFSRSRVHQFARNAFGSAKASVSSKTNGVSESTEGNTDTNRAVPDHLTLLQLLALNALDLTAPASNVLLKNRLNNWVQLSGHEGSFAPAGPGTIWKKSSKDRIEIIAYERLMKDTLASMVPHFYKDVEYNNEFFIEMQDLLYNFKNPTVMDIKMGTRTFLECEVENSKARSDLYEKMIKVDPNAPTPEEREAKAITKLRYMQFRENLSSSADMGFRIEGFKVHGQEPTKDLKLLRSKDEICRTMRQFLNGSEKVRLQVVARLQNLRSKLEKSTFFRQHEVGENGNFSYYLIHHPQLLEIRGRVVRVPPSPLNSAVSLFTNKDKKRSRQLHCESCRTLKSALNGWRV